MDGRFLGSLDGESDTPFSNLTGAIHGIVSPEAVDAIEEI